jgi:MFS transporter, SP family, solute carrier family 2 (myo-inositol transporter), member 13
LHFAGVISGAMLPIRRAFELTDWQQEVVVSSTVLAAFFSSLVGGSLNAAYGRRFAILTAAAVFAIGSLWLLLAWNYPTLVMGRIVVGIGIGIASLTTPIYIAEVAVPTMRGQLVTVNAFMVYVHCVLTSIISSRQLLFVYLICSQYVFRLLLK